MITSLVSPIVNSGPNGMPKVTSGITEPRKNQNSSWTRIGVPRNSQT